MYAQVIAAVILGALVGYFWPKYGIALQPLADGFIQLIRLVLAPVIFVTVVSGLARAGNLREAGRIGLKALIYFEVLSTLALAIGLIVANVVRPGAGMNIDPRTLDASSLKAYTTTARPATAIGLAQTLAHNPMLQVIFFAVVAGIALSFFRERAGPCLNFLEAATKALFFVVGLIMRAAPLGALGGVAFTVGHFGLGSLAALGRLLLALYITSALFVFIGLGLVVRAAAEAARSGRTAAEVAKVARDTAARVRLFIAVPTLKHLVRGGRVSATRGFVAKLLGLLPILTITPDGKVEAAAKARGYAASRRKMMRLLFAEAGQRVSTSRRFGVAHCDAEDAAEELAREIRAKYPESDVMIVECGPALGAHGGPGALAVAVLP